MDAYYTELISELKKKHLTKNQIARLKIKLCSKHKRERIPTDIEILLNAPKKDLHLLRSLQTKPTRTISGVAIIAVMTQPIGCPHGRCTMCPGGPNSFFGSVPQSYTGNEPASMRAARNLYDPYLQVFNRLEQYVVLGHDFDKVEIIIMGGTFPALPKRYQEEYVTSLFKAMNDFSSEFIKGELLVDKMREFFELPGDIYDKGRAERVRAKIMKLKGKSTLEKEHKRNEKSIIRCVGLTIETKPDWGLLKHGNEMLRLGCTRVELGIQTDDNKILQKINRGHTLQDSYDSIRILKDLGLKLNFHLMPGLPLSNPAKDLIMLKNMFDDSRFRPDMVKIYPTMVMPGTPLYDDWKKGKFKPLATKKAAEIIAQFMAYVPEYCRVMRVQRDIPTKVTSAGVDRTNLRQYVDAEMEKRKIVCRDIRAREAGRSKNIGKIAIVIREYESSSGVDYFISAEDDNDVLIGFCRLRFPSEPLRKEITAKSALIRELHVYGQIVPIGTHTKDVQHRGWGRKLLAQAEKIAKRNGKNKIVIISGVGVREYYRKLGYRKEGVYMVKKI